MGLFTAIIFVLAAGLQYSYDCIGNCRKSIFNDSATNHFSANNLNQYDTQLRLSATPRETAFTYDADGNMLSDGLLTYTYDSRNRLKTVLSNGTQIVENFYDAKSRRVRKVTSFATHAFFYDDWNIVEERIAYASGEATTIKYYWGKDLSGSMQGAGGIGGLLYLTVDGDVYIPCYDNNGNVTKYLDSSGNIVAAYTYDAFGKTISQSGALAEFFRHRFSTKYFDLEAELYYYGYRFYHPVLMRWLNRDPLNEKGGLNLYAFCGNRSVFVCDPYGLSCRVGSFNVLRLDIWEKPAMNGLSGNPEWFVLGEKLLGSIGMLGDLIAVSSVSSSAMSNFQTFVDALVGKGLTPDSDAIARLRELHEGMKSGPVDVMGFLEYELCVCNGNRAEFVKQEPESDTEFVLDGSDLEELQKARNKVLKRIVDLMRRNINGGVGGK